MNCRKLFCKLLLFSLIGAWHLHAELLFQTDTQIIHFPVKTAIEKQSIKLEAKLQGAKTRDSDMKIYFRVKGASNYQHVDMAEGVDNFTGNIPATFVKAPTMEYFVLAVLADNSMITDPPRNPYYAPHEVSVIASTESPDVDQQESPMLPSGQAAEGTISAMTILSPEPGAMVNEDEAVVAVSYMNEKGNINQRSIQLFFDDKEVTSKAEITSYLITYLPQSIKQGEHVVKIKARDTQGKELGPLEWRFQVDSYEPGWAFVSAIRIRASMI